jgi:site-specific DNA-cytosine methylase
VADVRDIDPHTLERPDALHSSTPCTRASVANSSAETNDEGTKESKIDIETAEATANFIRVLKPDIFTLENVYPYRKFKAFAIICAALHDVGYFYDYDNINAADFGVPQTRRRLFLRASRVGLVPQLPAPERWVGWYEAIEDLIDTLPESQFAEWQLARLPEYMKDNSLVEMMNASSDCTVVNGDNPSFTIGASAFRRPSTVPHAFIINPTRTSFEWIQESDAIEGSLPMATIASGNLSMAKYKAFIVPGGNATSFDIRESDEPARTVGDTNRVGNMPRAFIVDGKPANYAGDLQITDGDNRIVTVTSSQPRHPFRAWLSAGRVVKMTTRALARFQSFPDSYELPVKDSLACKVIGNAVCPLLYQKLIEALL